MSKTPFGDIIVLLPGITGSVLKKDGKDIWAPTPSAAFNALRTLGESVTSLALQGDDWHAPDLGDGIVADRLVPDIHTLPGLWKIDGYTAIRNFLLDQFDLTEGRNFFPFPYDWRRDNRASARRLAEESRTWLNAWRQGPGGDDAQLVLVGHSMGGLVARYFVEVLGGWENTRAVVTFGTPFYGSLNAVDFLVNGFRKNFGPFVPDLTTMLRSLTSLHQLVPVYRCIYGADGQAVTPARAGLPEWKTAWDDHVTQFQKEMEDAATENRASAAWQKNPVTYHPIVGTDQPTRQSCRLTGQKLELLMDRGGDDETGDGTVPSISAYLSGAKDARTFTPQLHAQLQSQRSMQDHLKGLLETLHARSAMDLRDAVTTWFSYRGDDLYLPDEPVTVDLSMNSRASESQLAQVEAKVTVHNRENNTTVLDRPVTVTRQQQPLRLGLLPTGTYDIQIASKAAAAPVSDIFLVAGADW
ncbi:MULTISPECIES: alpha/beta fold hydrolase [unclassified Streptomyces]|uniref:alpha/beta fold hydrolase n=1 Tax=unclassified Streptomyces TaxID=2593676 RepID=UPI000887E9DF|nr:MULTISPECIES: alpha/beta fold hydrolase [unclassified Streptomyces]PBC85955.1 lecithin:cholesterol acyltransferase [Streptomyces sp. 2321.6]SDR01143.1 Lecithin:cholesterol acyltransferase [Streptomyces sp. KS_16]SED83988.1 Lecithin:cholesterol acyltransferase [Streptomyces sp. 2133.1]SED89583.1 Lecithin:cholesterol acyltransferase [Streptomyces sp. 2112.3]SNC72836.1 Lecithin:cholesterol acyltransferase [Streptomyces sp. 2114.4]